MVTNRNSTIGYKALNIVKQDKIPKGKRSTKKFNKNFETVSYFRHFCFTSAEML